MIVLIYKKNIEKESLKNKFYRKVVFTGKQQQLVLMSLKPGDDIPMKVHHGIDQFFRVEQGKALVQINGKKFILNEEDVIIVPAESQHYVKNLSKKELKMYTIYSPPNHPAGRIHKTQAEADKAEAEEHNP